MLIYKRGIGWVEGEEPVAVVKLHNGYTVKAYDREPVAGETFTSREKIDTVEKLIAHLENCSFIGGGLKYPDRTLTSAWALEVFDHKGNKL